MRLGTGWQLTDSGSRNDRFESVTEAIVRARQLAAAHDGDSTVYLWTDCTSTLIFRFTKRNMDHSASQKT